MTDRHTRKDRLERAGYRHVAGWLPYAVPGLVNAAKRAEDLIELHRPDVERIAAEPKPRGRRKKEMMK